MSDRFFSILATTQQGNGEWIETYATDWRTTPLFTASGYQLGPGDLVAQVAGVSVRRALISVAGAS